MSKRKAAAPKPDADAVPRQPTVRVSLEAKAGIRVECEQRALRVLENARRSLWTLRQLRFELREERRRVMARWPHVRRAAGRGWYAAVRVVFGCSVRKLTDARQVVTPEAHP